MGFFSRLFGGSGSGRDEVRAPGDDYATPAAAIEHLLARHAAQADTWVTLTAEADDGSEVVIQVAEESINLLQTALDLPAFLEELGLTALAAHAREQHDGDDPTLWRLEGASREELTAVVDHLFAAQLGRGYRLTGWIER